MGRLRDFVSIVAYFSDREIEEMQAVVDARREDRAGRPGDNPPRAGRPVRDNAAGPEAPEGGGRAG